MIRQIVKEKNTIPIIGGFVAKSADPILAHVNPSRLQEQDLFILIQADQTILISPDLIINEQFANEADYLKFIAL